MLVRFLFLLLLPSVALGGNRFHERNHAGLLALYGFDDGQRDANLRPTHARDYTGRYLLGNLTTSTSTITWNRDRAGFTVPSDFGGQRVVSERNSSDLVRQLSSSAFTIEFFMSNTVNTRKDIIVFGFGNWLPGRSFPACDSDGQDTDEGGWRMASFLGESLAFQTVMMVNDPVPQPGCFELSFATLSNTLRHGVLGYSDPGLLRVKTHSSSDVIYYPDLLSFSPELWLRNPTHLTFAPPHPHLGWKGTIFMIAIFDRFLPDDEVALNRALGPPNSLATTETTSIETVEDTTLVLWSS